MSNPSHHDNERESLSALFDGELHGDAARFALKRLDHDRDWREACGRWQLVGDVLRGQATAMAPAGFAERVAAALDEVPVAGAAAIAGGGIGVGTGARVGTRSRRRWAGGAALAASVALAALFVSRPTVAPGPDALPATPLAAAPATVPADDSTGAMPSLVAAAPDAAPDQAPADAMPAPMESPAQSPSAAIALAGTAVAVVETPRRIAERRARAAAATSATIREALDPQPLDPQAALAAAAPAGSDADTLRPFLPQGEIVTRPWPRATLRDDPRDAFTASFGDTPSPSFYPFEPEQLDAGMSSADDASNWPRR